ncbi:MAG: hypothetical protein LIV22_03855, partial [Olegusella sp.]|nr:hypothetical protein [Olegusella sp.]
MARGMYFQAFCSRAVLAAFSILSHLPAISFSAGRRLILSRNTAFEAALMGYLPCLFVAHLCACLHVSRETPLVQSRNMAFNCKDITGQKVNNLSGTE